MVVFRGIFFSHNKEAGIRRLLVLVQHLHCARADISASDFSFSGSRMEGAAYKSQQLFSGISLARTVSRDLP